MATSSNQNSSSATSGLSFVWRRGVRVRDRGMPKTCRCGQASVIKTSGTAKNPGRLFHCCPFGSENDNYHLFKWTDESMVEEIEDMKEMIGNLEHETRTCSAMVNCSEKEIEDMKAIVRGYEKEMEAMKTKLEGCEEMVGEVRLLKNIIVCGVVVIACYYYFWA